MKERPGQALAYSISDDGPGRVIALDLLPSIGKSPRNERRELGCDAKLRDNRIGHRYEPVNGTMATDKSIAEQFSSAATAADFLSIWLHHRLLSDASQKIMLTTITAIFAHSIRREFGTGTINDLPKLRRWCARTQAFVSWRSASAREPNSCGGACSAPDVTGIDAFQHCINATAERLDVLQRATGRKLNCSLQTVQITDFEDEQALT